MYNMSREAAMNTNAYHTEPIPRVALAGLEDFRTAKSAETLPGAQRFRTMISLLCAMLLCASIAPQTLSQSLAPSSPETITVSSEQLAPTGAVQEKNALAPEMQSPSTAYPSTRTLVQNGWYIGMELGVAFAPKMKVFGMDTDVATTCDGFFVTDTANAQGCNPPPAEWSNEVGTGSGVVAGLAFGYRIQSLRAEGEYFYRTVSRDETTELDDIFDAVTQDKAEQELEVADSGIENALSHNLFVNLYYDFHSERKLTPYLGIGAGAARMSLDYFGRFKRNSRPQAITTFPNNPDGTISDLNRLLAGTTTIGNAKLKDTLFGYQALAGLDYHVSDAFTMGLKVRWTGYFGKFEDGREWDQLRSHDSARSPGGARVAYTITTEDLGSWGISLATKYQF